MEIPVFSLAQIDFGHRAMPILGSWFLVFSVITFLAYAKDKSAARNNRWRIPESTLHFLSFFGGWPGALFAQRILRHKNRKLRFQIVFWFTLITNVGFCLWFLLSPHTERFRLWF